MDLEGQSDKALAYVTFRLSLGIGELMHGLVRLPIMATFAADMAKGFEGTILPGWFIYAFGLVLPFLEALIGISLIVGLLTKWALFAGSLLMSILIFGTCLRSDWAFAGAESENRPSEASFDNENRKSCTLSIAPPAVERVLGYVHVDDRQVYRAAACIQDYGGVLFDRRHR